MERFLLIQCWTKYKWQSLDSLTSGKTPPFYLLIQRGYVLHNGLAIKKPVEIILVTPKSLLTIATDSSGYFEMNQEMLTTEPDWRLTLAVNEKHQADYAIILQNDNDVLQQKLAELDYPETQRILFIPEEIPLGSVKTLAPVIVQSKNAKDDEDALRFIKGIKKNQELCRDYVCMYNIINCINHPYEATKPQLGRSYQIRKFGATLETITYRGCITGYNMNKINTPESTDTIVYQLKGRYYSKQFYVADYEKYNPPVPETLTTLYWNPFIQTDEKGEASFSFYTNDLKGRLALIAEGVSGGSVLSAKRIFRVKSEN
jgi:hypothetical protein